MQQLHFAADSLFAGSSCTASAAFSRLLPHESVLLWMQDHGCGCIAMQLDAHDLSSSCTRAAELWPAAKGYFWMRCGVGVAFVSVGASHYSAVANATLPQDVHVARAHATSKALFLLVSVSALASGSSTASIPEGIWRVTVSHSSRSSFLRLRVIPCSSSAISLDSRSVFAAHESGAIALINSASLLVLSSSLSSARYVRFQSRSPEGHFQVSSVSVHTADGSNVAYGKPVSVSASFAEGAPCGNVVKGQPEARNHPVCRVVVLPA